MEAAACVVPTQSVCGCVCMCVCVCVCFPAGARPNSKPLISSCVLNILLTAGALNYVFQNYRPICGPLSCSNVLEKLPYKNLMRVMRLHEQLHCGLHDIINRTVRKKVDIKQQVSKYAGKYFNLCSPVHPG